MPWFFNLTKTNLKDEARRLGYAGELTFICSRKETFQHTRSDKLANDKAHVRVAREVDTEG